MKLTTLVGFVLVRIGVPQYTGTPLPPFDAASEDNWLRPDIVVFVVSGCFYFC